MTEPTIPSGVGIVAVAIALLGPAAGPYAVIVLSALAGALWALASAPTDRRLTGALLLLRLVLMALVLTGSAAWALEARYGWPVHQLLAPVAFGIGMGGDAWRAIFDGTLAALGRRARRSIGGDQ